MATASSPGFPRGMLHGVSGIVIAVIALLVLGGGAFAIGRTTAPTASTPPTASLRDQDISGTGGGAMMTWARAHPHEFAWMRNHPAQWVWMQHHAGQSWWMRATPPQRAWMRAHRGDIAWMHDHWNAWQDWREHQGTGRGSSHTVAGPSSGDWCGNGWMCH